jgi:signal transduction histidine kinase
MTEEFIRTALFRPFASSKAGGLGLGLSQSKSIVEAHGGSIEVTSQPGSGSRFAVTLPLHDAARAGA